MLSQKWRQNIFAEIAAGITAEFKRAERTGIVNFLPVMPWPHHQEQFVVVRVFRLESSVDRGGSVDVFLVPQAVDEHGWDFQRLRREDFVHCLLLPPRIVAGMLQQFAPESNLL